MNADREPPPHHPPSPRRRKLAVLTIVCAGAAAVGAAQQQSQPPVITSFQMNGGAATILATAPVVELRHVVAGTRPAEFRVSHRADFSDATWEPYVVVPVARLWFTADRGPCGDFPESHTVILYFQVRSDLGVQLKVVNGQRAVVPQKVESNVVRDSICAVKGRTNPD